LSLVFHGQLPRGGLAIGEMYMNEYSANGVALIEAHAAEDVRGAPPRIVLSPSAVGVFAAHARYFGGVQRLHTIPLLEDPSDGKWFVDYLAPIMGVRPYTGFDPIAVKRHRDMIVAGLERWHEVPSVRSKYRWLAAYHDASVAQRTDRKDLLVAADVPEAPRLISDVSFDAVVRKIAPDRKHIPPADLLSRVARTLG
jgi:hypothetical protein